MTVTLTENVSKKRGVWELFEVADGYDLSEARSGHLDKNGRLWLLLGDSLLCTDGRSVSARISVGTGRGETSKHCAGFTSADFFWCITDDKRLLAYRLQDGACEDHTDKVPSLDGAYWLWTSRHEDIVIGIPGKVIRYDCRKAVSYDVPVDELGRVRCATIAPGGDLWVASENGLHHFAEGGVRLYSKESVGKDYLWDILVDRHGDVWFPSGQEIRVLRAGSTGLIDCVEKNTQHPVHPGMIDDEGNLWGYAFFVGVFFVNDTGAVVFPLEETPGVKAPTSIVQDNTGALWFIGVGNGICRYNPTRLNVLGGIRIEAATMSDDGTILLAAASRGLLAYKGEGYEQICREAPYGCRSLSMAGDGILHIAANVIGMSRCDISSGVLTHYRDIPGLGVVSSYSFSSTAVTSDGSVWCAGRKGLYRLAEGGVEFFKWSELGITSNDAALFTDSFGIMWIVGDVRNPVTQWTRDGFVRFAEKPGVGLGSVRCIFEENDTYIWFCTWKGSVLRCNRKNGKFELMMSLGSLTVINDFRIDGRGLKWIATDKGLFLSDDRNNYFLQESCQLPSRKVLRTWELADGRVAIVTEYGLCEYVYSDKNQPVVFVSRIETDQVYERPVELTFHGNQSRVIIHIGAVNMKQGPLKYQVRLLGYNDNWFESWKSEITYEHLPLGTYTFEVRAVDQDLMTTEDPARVNIAVIEDPREKAISELEGELRGAKDFAANVIKSINEAIIVLDTDGVIVTTNDAAHDLLDCTEEAMLGEPVRKFLPEQSVHLFDAGGIARLAKRGSLKSGERQLKKMNGDCLPVLLSGSCLHDGDGKLQGFVIAASDLSEYKHLQSQMLHSQKMESLGVLAGGIAHDFNNMLAVIQGNAELSLAAAEEGSVIREYLADAISASEQAAKLCSEMLAYAGKEQTFRVAVDVSKMVEHNAALLRSAISRKVELQCDLPEGLPKVLGDEVQLMQIVMNFITNAAEAIGDNEGTIYLTTRSGTFSQKELSSPYSETSLPDGEYVVLEIRDTGCGMDRATMAKMFEPFFTTKFTGRGLGLSAVHGIVKSHGAALTVDSKPGKGTSFRLFCPVLAEEPAEAEVKTAFAEPAEGSGTVLLVDDEQALLTLAANIFKTMGYDSITAVDGVDGLLKLKGSIDKITVVFLDMTMPRMDGAEAYGHMRHLKPDLPIIICSGYSESDISSRFIKDEKLHFVRKPYTRDQIAIKLAEAFGG